MVIVDSSVWIDFLADRAGAEVDWLQRSIGKRAVGLTNLILCEVLQGASSDRAFIELNNALQRFQIFDVSGPELAISAARNYRLLRNHGVTVRATIDCLVATFCIENGHQLLHRDRDYDAFERFLGLQVVRTVDA